MERAVEPQIVHPRERLIEIRLAQQVEQLVAQARRREVADEPHIDAATRQGERVRRRDEPVVGADQHQRRRRDRREVAGHRLRKNAAPALPLESRDDQ